MILQNPARVRPEDYEEDDTPQTIISKLGGALNSFMREVYQLQNKNVTIQDNLNQQLFRTPIVVDANGVPDTRLRFSSSLKSSASGMSVIRAVGEVNVTSHPFASFSESEGLIEVTHVSGLPPGQEFILTVLIIGD